MVPTARVDETLRFLSGGANAHQARKKPPEGGFYRES
jgi:hypothetical protein